MQEFLGLEALTSCDMNIGDNVVTSSIRIAQVFPELVGKRTHAIWKVYGGMLKYKLCLLFSAYDAYFHINDDAKKCRFLSVTNNFIFSHDLINCFHMKYYKKYVLL